MKTKQIKILAIIPARGGSKGVKDKNFRQLNGKPLISHTIKAALSSNLIEKVVVSSDSHTILEMATKYGAQTIKRPSNLATDTATSESVIKHALEQEQSHGNYYDYLLLLQPTSPFRTTDHINQAIKKLISHPQADCLVSVYKNTKTPYLTKQLDKYGYLKEFHLPSKSVSYRRQDSPPTYVINGAIYLIKSGYFAKTKSLYSLKMIPLVMDRVSSLDIDDLLDLEIANYLAPKLLK